MTRVQCLRNATVFDGSGSDAYQADVLLEAGRVRKIHRGALVVAPDVEDIDLEGLWLMPGFIDIHTHYDAEIEVMPSLSESTRHGVTTIFMGSCGLSMVMGRSDHLADMFTRVEGIPSHHVKPLLRDLKKWDGPESYYQHLEALPLGPNVACFLGHSTLRSAVMGLERSVTYGVCPTEDELRRMRACVIEALDAGYLGMSINCLDFDKMDGASFRSRPTPSVFAKWREYHQLSSALRERGRVLQAVPSLSRPWTIPRTCWESVGIGRDGLKTSLLALVDTKAFPGFYRIIGGVVRTFNRWLRGKIRVQAIPAPFDLWVDGFEAPVFEEFEAGTSLLHLTNEAERGALLRDVGYRRRFRRQWAARFAPKVFHRDLRLATIVSCPDATTVGLTFQEAALRRGQKAVDFFLDLVARYGERVRWRTVIGNDNPKSLRWILENPDVHIGFSDAGAHLRNMGYYNFPLRMLRFVREQHARGLSSLRIEDAVYKLTGELADWFGVDAGRIAEGRRADLVAIDPMALDQRLEEAHEEPMRPFPGLTRVVRRNDATVPFVWINGRVAWRSGRPAEDLGYRSAYGAVLRTS